MLRVAWLVLLLWLGAPASLEAAPGWLVDAVVGEVGGEPIVSSDIALARALGLFGLQPGNAPIDAPAVEQFASVSLVLEESTRLGLTPTPEEVEAAWGAAVAGFGGAGVLDRWLGQVGGDRAWARRLVTADLAWRRFVEARFHAFVFVGEEEIAATLGPGPHTDADRERARKALSARAVDRALADWLAEARSRVGVRVLLAPGETLPLDLRLSH